MLLSEINDIRNGILLKLLAIEESFVFHVGRDCKFQFELFFKVVIKLWHKVVIPHIPFFFRCDEMISKKLRISFSAEREILKLFQIFGSLDVIGLHVTKIYEVRCFHHIIRMKSAYLVRF